MRAFAITVAIANVWLGLCNSVVHAAEPKVVVTIKPIHALVARVMEGMGTPQLLVAGNASPHTFALKPSDARAINEAKVFFRVAEDVEPFTTKIMKSLPKSVSTATLAAAPGLELLNRRTGGTFEPEAHGKGKHGHAHHDHDDKGGRDGHVWLDPENARKMAAEVTRVLSAAYPEHRGLFEANAKKLDKDLEALAGEIAATLEPVKGRPFVVFHDATQYFERRFGVPALGSITASPEAQPSAKRLTEIRSKLAKLKAACVFAEPQFSNKLVDAVTEGTGARGGMLDPEGIAIEAGPGAYHALLRGLAASMKGCLAEGS